MTPGQLFNSVSRKTRSRYFLRCGPTTNYERGFRSRDEVDRWLAHEIEVHGLDYRVGYYVKFRSMEEAFSVVKKDGEELRP